MKVIILLIALLAFAYTADQTVTLVSGTANGWILTYSDLNSTASSTATYNYTISYSETSLSVADNAYVGVACLYTNSSTTLVVNDTTANKYNGWYAQMKCTGGGSACTTSNMGTYVAGGKASAWTWTTDTGITPVTLDTACSSTATIVSNATIAKATVTQTGTCAMPKKSQTWNGKCYDITEVSTAVTAGSALVVSTVTVVSHTGAYAMTIAGIASLAALNLF